MSFAGNNSGYQEVLCPLLEITVDIRRSCVLCSKCRRWTSSRIHICRCTSWRTFYLSPPPPRNWRGAEGLPQLPRSGFLRNPFHFSICESHSISTLQWCTDSVSAWCSSNNMRAAFRFFFSDDHIGNICNALGLSALDTPFSPPDIPLIKDGRYLS